MFEQSYGGVDGDSASAAELFALLSALAEAPIEQCFAVTGSVDQRGQIQAIGGVNEKIEGFFDSCQIIGFTGRQGVIIPASNVKHLMLRRDVVAAAEAGRFAIYPIDTVDQGLELLTGMPAGEPDADGNYPAGTLNQRIAARLDAFAAKAAELARAASGSGRAAMSGPIERVVVPLDAASENRTAIETAARLAARARAPLHGVFIEDEELLRLAGLPFARQVTIGRGAEPFTSESIELQLRAAAERARQELVAAAKRHRVECTFEIVRGAIASWRWPALRNATWWSPAGWADRSPGISGSSRWWSSIETAPGPFLLARSAWTAPGSVVILLRDRDAASARLFETAAQIAAARDSMLAVLCAPTLAGSGRDGAVDRRTRGDAPGPGAD